jgi:hypothetical protein
MGERGHWRISYKRVAKEVGFEVLLTGLQTPALAWRLAGLNLCN